MADDTRNAELYALYPRRYAVRKTARNGKECAGEVDAGENGLRVKFWYSKDKYDFEVDDDLISTLTPRSQELLRLRADGMVFRLLAEHFDITETRAKQIYRTSGMKLLKEIRKREADTAARELAAEYKRKSEKL